MSYQRDGDSPTTLTITPTKRSYPAVGDDQFVVQIAFWDWVITSADLSIEPREGDRIIDGETVYTVLPPQGMKAVEGWDANGVGWLVHTQVTRNG